jgi:uncharacterized membrane protein YgcG
MSTTTTHSSFSGVTSAPSLSTAITIRLSRTNFFLWKAQVTPILRAHQLFGHVDSSLPPPTPVITTGTGADALQVPNPDYLRCFAFDQLILSALLASMSEEMLGQMTQHTSAVAAWSALHAMFSSQNRAQIMQVRYQLSNAKKADLTAAAYFQKMKGYADTMASLGHPLSDEEVLGYMLAGLGSDFESFVTTVALRDTSMDLNTFFAHLLSAEARLQRYTSTGEIHSSANAATRHPFNTRSGGHGGQNRGRGGSGRGNGGGGHNSGRGGSGPKPTCQVCNIYGHDALHCRQRFNHAYQPDDTRERQVNAAATPSYSVDTNWYLDSGANDHLTNDLDQLSLHERYTGKDIVQVANGSGLSIAHIGHSLIPGSSRPLYLHNILHVPSVRKNLLSIQKLAHDNDAFVELHPSFFCIKDQKSRRTLLRGKSFNGLYPVPCSKSSSPMSRHAALSSHSVSSDLWHCWLGHPSFSVVDFIVKSNKLACTPRQSSRVCDPYQRAKAHQLPFQKSKHVTSPPLELVHSDVWGPAVTSVGGFKYYVSFLDDFSRFTWIYLLKRKSDVEHAFHLF